MVSCVSSDKAYLPGHRTRLEFVESIMNNHKIDFFGRGINPIDSKFDVLKDYAFSISIEMIRPGDMYHPDKQIWVDDEYLLPIKEELYAKSGKLLKSTSIDRIKKIQGRWFPTRFIFKDELKRNSKGTEWVIEDIQFDVDIPSSRFSKALLRK